MASIQVTAHEDPPCPGRAGRLTFHVEQCCLGKLMPGQLFETRCEDRHCCIRSEARLR